MNIWVCLKLGSIPWSLIISISSQGHFPTPLRQRNAPSGRHNRLPAELRSGVPPAPRPTAAKSWDKNSQGIHGCFWGKIHYK